uniref:Claudin domain containing 1b n=1 Tax=Cyprinus carpio carpio TaxID=630221 RepID=A0A8C1BK50_CYPCA
MVDNRYATALVIGSVLSLLAAVYLSVAMGTQHWYQYQSQPASNDANNGSDLQKLGQVFEGEDVNERNYSDALFWLNGTLGLWWRCILVPQDLQGFKEPDPIMVTKCQAFTLAQQWKSKYKSPGNIDSGEDLLRTYLWKCQFLLPLVSVGLVFLAALVGVCACLCRSITPTLFVGLLHLLAVFLNSHRWNRQHHLFCQLESNSLFIVSSLIDKERMKCLFFLVVYGFSRK